jgi:hypothetical protein
VTEPTVMDMVLAELKSIRESIHSLRDDVNGKFAGLSSQVAGHEQWIDLAREDGQPSRSATPERTG